jgi:hypothetical protein
MAEWMYCSIHSLSWYYMEVSNDNDTYNIIIITITIIIENP